MEAWHSVDLNSLTPLTALSLTTSRWGLEPLPGNIALRNFTDSHSPANTSLTVLEFVSWCARSSEFIEEQTTEYYYIPKNTTFCSKPKTCGQSNCTNLVEGIGRTTVGPTGADIVGLAHGISILIVIVSTIIMGWLTTKLDKLEAKFPPRVKGLEADDIKKHYHHPPRPDNPPVPITVRAPPDEKKSKEVSHCIDLLRQMYDLELQIQASRDNIYGTGSSGTRRRERADALRNEIQHIVNEWRAMPPGFFTREERGLVDEICAAINGYQRGR